MSIPPNVDWLAELVAATAAFLADVFPPAAVPLFMQAHAILSGAEHELELYGADLLANEKIVASWHDRKCPVCHVGRGQPCENVIQLGEPLPGRAVHLARMPGAPKRFTASVPPRTL